MTDTPLIERLAEAVAGTSAPLDADDRLALAELLPLIERETAEQGLALDEERELAVAVHGLSLVRRVRDREHLDPLAPQLYAEVPGAGLAAARRLIDTYCMGRDYTAPDSEVLLLALHFEVARQHTPVWHRQG